ncbi:MAG: hypothetical protein HY907_16380 [Deltaproteobacteria bacterium]|nr:hypothetical protein [Deltaproteobacteria bacterium]
MKSAAARNLLVVLALVALPGCAVPDDEVEVGMSLGEEAPPEGGKLDAFASAVAELLANDATGLVDYASCAEVRAHDIGAALAAWGLDRDRADGMLDQDLRFTAFRKVATLAAAVQFVTLSGPYRPLELPESYAALPDYSRYFEFVQYLNLSLELQREVLHEAFGTSEFGGSGDSLDAFWASVERQREDLDVERTRVGLLRDEGARLVRLRELDARELALLELLATVDPSRAERQRLFQGSLKAAAVEAQVLGALTGFLDGATGGWDPWSFDGPAVWRNDLGGAPIRAAERLRQIYARYPILAADDSLLRDHDLAERIFAVVSPDLSAHERAAAIAAAGGRWQLGWDLYAVDEEALRTHLAAELYPELDALSGSALDVAVQEEVDWAIADWRAALARELEALPGRGAGELLEFPDLVDAAIAAAPAALQLAYMDRYCAAQSRADFLSGARTATYLGLTAISIGAMVFGQVEIAVPVGWLMTALTVGEAIWWNLREADLYDAQRTFYVPYERYTEAERQRLFLTATAAVSVAVEAYQAAKLLDGWKKLQAMKARLRTLAGEADVWAAEYSEARAAWLRVVDAGVDSTDETARLARAVAGYSDADGVARIARRTLDFIDGSEAMRGGLGRIALADLVNRVGGEANALTFFERVSRSYPRWSREARAGYRMWLRAIDSADAAEPMCR